MASIGSPVAGVNGFENKRRWYRADSPFCMLLCRGAAGGTFFCTIRNVIHVLMYKKPSVRILFYFRRKICRKNWKKIIILRRLRISCIPNGWLKAILKLR
jgi:hypothetical protein